MYKCYLCDEQFSDARHLKIHVPTHLNQCPLCSRTFGSLLELSNHVNNAHGAALAEDRKKCLYCDAAFGTFDELGRHSKENHRFYYCDICFAGFVSVPLLVEHRVSDHPRGCPDEPGKHSPSAPEEETATATKVTDPKLDKAMEVIPTPEPDPFADKWHPAFGQVKADDKNKVKCEVCHRYLKSSKHRVEHVKHFHPLVAYDCKFCPDWVFYTVQDLARHCQINHLVCDPCNSVFRNEEALQAHNRRHHQAPQVPQVVAPSTATSPPPGAEAPEGEPNKPRTDDRATGTGTASEANVRPARPGFRCGICQRFSPTGELHKIHLFTHKKIICQFCPQKFFNTASRDAHIREKHHDRTARLLVCKLAPGCKVRFQSTRELGIHMRHEH